MTPAEVKSKTNAQTANLAAQVQNLAPWHMGIQVNDDLNTGMLFSEEGQIVHREKSVNEGISLLQLRDAFLKRIDQIYPDGLEGKTFLDCACNAGGYGFWLAERGLKYGLGFDVREHWINQAKWVQEHRTIAPTDMLEFVVSDLYDLPKMRLDPFDITMFKGIFYHLPDPVTGLKIAADLTREVLFLNTSTAWGEKDGYLKCAMESRELLMSGVHGMCWYPTGPEVLATMLKWLGFEETRLMFNFQMKDAPHLGRVEIVAARTKGMLDRLPGELI